MAETEAMRTHLILRLFLAAILLTSGERSGHSFVDNRLDPIPRRRSVSILANVDFGQTTKLAIVDTGCSTAAVHSVPGSILFTDYPSQERVFGTPSGIISRRCVRHVPSGIGDLPQMPLDVIATDMSVIPSTEYWGINAIVGMEYLRNFVLTIRGREGTSTLETKLNRKPAGDRILLHFHTGVPYITVPIVGGFSQDFVVDTGKDDGLSLSPELAKRLQRLEHAVASDNDTFLRPLVKHLASVSSCDE